MRQAVGRFGTVLLVSVLAVSACASSAVAAPLSLTFTESRANVGVQLSDAALFEAPDVAPLEAEIDPGSGAITAGVLTVPQFSTFITEPLDANVAVDFEIGVVSGSFDQSTGALTLEGTAGGTLTADGKECTVATVPPVLALSTAGNSGGANPRSGSPFTNGLTGAGAIGGQWTDMTATPTIPGDGIAVCETVDERIGGPGGVWLFQAGDVVPPSAPLLTGTTPASPSRISLPLILGSAEPGSTVRLFAGANCPGSPLITTSATELASPGLTVEVAEGVTATFSATATDPAGNTSPCSAPISYTRTNRPPPPPPPPASCAVPKLVGRTLAKAKAALTAASCKLGKVRRVVSKRAKRPKFVVKSASPGAGAMPADGEVDLVLAPKPRKTARWAR